MSDLEFANKPLLFLLIGLIPLIAWYIYKNKNIAASLQVSTLKAIKTVSFKNYLVHFPFAFRVLAIGLLVIALARPQSSKSWENKTTKGIDIVLALDISSSMLAKDFEPNRLEASKSVAIEFISGRPLDRIGLVIFAGETFTQCPITTNHAELINLFKDIKSGMIEDGTAIGMGLANAVNRLKDSKAISKVVILLTDGVNNKGDIAPITAAEVAKTYGVRTYTVGVGTQGKAPYPFQTPFGTQMQNIDVEIDEVVLKEIAKITDGKYFRATDNKKLKDIYKEIDKLEKSKIEVKEFRKKKEEYLIFAVLAGIFLLLEFLLKTLVLRRIP